MTREKKSPPKRNKHKHKHKSPDSSRQGQSDDNDDDRGHPLSAKLKDVSCESRGRRTRRRAASLSQEPPSLPAELSFASSTGLNANATVAYPVLPMQQAAYVWHQQGPPVPSYPLVQPVYPVDCQPPADLSAQLLQKLSRLCHAPVYIAFKLG